jgi:hypothetical protein
MPWAALAVQGGKRGRLSGVGSAGHPRRYDLSRLLVGKPRTLSSGGALGVIAVDAAVR